MDNGERLPSRKMTKRVSRAKLELVGRAKAQLRKAQRRRWSNARERTFLTVLSETCNVTQAAAEAGIAVSSAYARKRKYAAFRAGWSEAIGAAYQRLELVLLDRAFNGVEKVVRRRDGSEERMVEYSNAMALTLLKMHRESAVEALVEHEPDDVAAIREKLLARLERMRERFEREDGAIE